MKLVVVGTGQDSHIRLNSQYVSNYHAEILLLDNGDILLTDKGSKNGTYINDVRLQPNVDVPVKRGDSIRFADVVLDWDDVPNIPLPDITTIKEIIGIGTNFRNKIQLQGESVSRFHATLTKKNDNKWYIQDHSKNGTTVNNQRISPNINIRLKRGDKIKCAGVEVKNPCGNGTSFNYKRITIAVVSSLLCCGLIYGIYHLISNKSLDEDNTIASSKILTDEEIYSTYRNSTVMVIGFYYYHISAGNLSLEKFGLPTDVVLNGGKLHPVKNREDMNMFTGTGFFISEDGKIATNLHIVRPWLFGGELSKIADVYRLIIASAAENNPMLNAFTSQIKVEGVMGYTGIITNGSYFSNENIKQCRELYAHDNLEKDVAILQMESKKLPEDVNLIVDVNNAVLTDDGIRVGSHIYTMGFPFGLTIQDLKSPKGVQLLASDGSITQECTEYSFGFNAPSYGGASGSPLFNNKGQLIGVLSSGVSKSQGFNFAIKPIYIKQILENQSSK